MKNINWNMTIALCYTFFMVCTGCNKLLEVPDNAGGQTTTSEIFTDSANAVMGILGLYGSGTLSLQNLEKYASLGADELIPNDTLDPTRIAYYKNDLNAGFATSGSAPTSVFWSNYYGNNGIYLANAALEGLSKDKLLTTTLRNQLMGECLFIRAFYHFYLVNLFGDIPIVTSTSLPVNQVLPRSPVSEVYDQIEKDLLSAQAMLTPEYPTAGRLRPNRYTVSALLARVYLYRQQWTKAAALCESILESGKYSLEANLDSVFLDGSKEAIWQLGSNLPDYPQMIPGFPALLPISSFLTPTYSCSPFLLRAFDSGDKRKTRWINDSIYNYPYKYRNSPYSFTPPTTTEDFMIFRLAEIYLIRAECKARHGDLVGAMEDVNIIRSRAGLTIPKTATSLQKAMSLILHERQVELFAEWGHRWLDLKRTDSINNILGREKPWWPADGHAALYPIPNSELITNPSLKQNPGY